MGLIYGYENIITGKWYVGQTTKSMKKRAGADGIEYLEKTKSGTYKHSKFAPAIVKYGWNAFKGHILERVSKKELDEREIFWIHEKDSFNNGYNATLGGDKPPVEMTESKKKRMSTGRMLKVKMFSMNGEFIKEFNSLQEAGKYAGLSNPCQISANCRGLSSSAGGYIWEYSDPKKAMNKKKYSDKTKKNFLEKIGVKVTRVDENGNIKEYNSIKEAAIDSGIAEVTLSKYAESGEVYNGYKFTKTRMTHKKKAEGQERAVLMYEGEKFIREFPSIKAAQEYMANLGKDGSSITRVCSGKRRQTGGYIWRYKESYGDKEYVKSEQARKAKIKKNVIDRKYERRKKR